LVSQRWNNNSVSRGKPLEIIYLTRLSYQLPSYSRPGKKMQYSLESIYLLLAEGKGQRGPSAFQLLHKSQKLEIHNEKHFKESHKKENFTRQKY
jgi:hypothetical protein